jgi:hypothetical protein
MQRKVKESENPDMPDRVLQQAKKERRVEVNV